MDTFGDGRPPSCATTTQGRLLVHAPNIHQGGGRTLLIALLESLAADHAPKHVLVTLDQRLQLDEGLAHALDIIRVAPTLRARLWAEWSLFRQARKSDRLLCFGNLPPLLPVKARVSVLVQNRYLVAPIDLKDLPPRVRHRIVMERTWLRYGLHSAEVLVQTPSMASDVLRSLGVAARVTPFVPMPVRRHTRAAEESQQLPLYDFVYVASGEPHKNHRRLIEAWIELARRLRFPSLCLTLDRRSNDELLRWIDKQSRAHGLRVVNAGHLDREAVDALYATSRALIYPSLVESFGLPLLEAHAAGLPIVAAECDYVRDVVSPAECFDPLSPVSMARAVLRYLNTPEQTATPLSAEALVAQLLQVDDAPQADLHERPARDSHGTAPHSDTTP